MTFPPKPLPQGGDYRPHYPKRQADAYMAALEARVVELSGALEEMVDLMEGVRLEGYRPDSFTCQVARIALQGSGPLMDPSTTNAKAHSMFLAPEPNPVVIRVERAVEGVTLTRAEADELMGFIDRCAHGAIAQ